MIFLGLPVSSLLNIKVWGLILSQNIETSRTEPPFDTFMIPKLI